jgi:tRNA (uracil-5-)-methyltransferase TRM9
MTIESERKLINLNKAFYDNISQHWNNDPNYYWRGWYNLLPYLQSKIETKGAIRILDLGCGNGRFLSFLEANFANYNNISYTGIDNADFKKIDKSLYPNISSDFLDRDLLEVDWRLEGKYDIVVAFGIIHHIPGERLLISFFNNLQKVLETDGLSVVTTWQYMRLERLQKRLIVGPERVELLKNLDIGENELRMGDNFLDWIKGNYGIRFSHYFEEAEVRRILPNFDLTVLEVFLEDDRERNRNQYFVLKKIPNV